MSTRLRDIVSWLADLVGLVLVVAGVYVLAGQGWSLVAAGIILLVVGVAAELGGRP